MSALGLLLHLLNFIAPAVLVGLLVALLAPVLMKKARPRHTWRVQFAMNFVACCLALVLGLWLFGRDGKMATYAAMVLLCAASQWFAGKAWRN